MVTKNSRGPEIKLGYLCPGYNQEPRTRRNFRYLHLPRFQTSSFSHSRHFQRNPSLFLTPIPPSPPLRALPRAQPPLLPRCNSSSPHSLCLASLQFASHRRLHLHGLLPCKFVCRCRSNPTSSLVPHPSRGWLREG